MSEQIKLVVDRKNKHGTDFYYPVCELSQTLVKLKGNTKKSFNEEWYVTFK